MLKIIKKESPLVLFFVAISSGIIVSHYSHFSLFSLLIFTSSMIFLTILFPKVKYKDNLYFILLFLLGMTAHKGYNFVSADCLLNFSFPSEKYQIAGIVESRRIYTNKQRLVLKNVTIEGQNYSGKILTTIKNRNQQIFNSDGIEYTGTLYFPDGARNPGEFDYKNYLKKRRIYLLSYVDTKKELSVSPNTGISLSKFADIIKTKIMKNIDHAMSGEPAHVLKALIVGARDELDGKTSEIFVYSGTIHILAVSGLHVAYVTLAFFTIFTFLRFKDKPRTLFTILALVFYIYIVDFKPSVVRAVIMASMILLGKSWERKVNVYNSLAAAGFIQLLISPNQLFDAGFQLSFSAVFSIVYFYRKLNNLFSLDFAKRHKFQKYFFQLFVVSLSALIGTLPITAFYFNRVSPIGLIANLIAIPLISVIGAAGFAQVILGFFIPSVNLFYGQVNQLAIQLLIKLTHISASVPLGSINVPSISIFHVLLFYLAIFAIFNLNRPKVKFAFLTSVLIFLNVQLWWAIIRKPKLEITFFDVGQGDAALIKFPSGEKMLIDTGDNTFSRNYAKSVILPFLIRRNIRQLDIIALSHPHNDHIGGTPYLLENISVGEIWEPKVTARSKTFRRIHLLADSLEIPIKHIFAGDYQNFGETDLFVLHPSKKYLSTNPQNFNHYSITFKISYGDFDLLFTGDIERQDEEYISLFGDFIDCEILKIPHHGSNTSSSDFFIDKVNPDIGFVSVGRKNKFKHPSLKIINRYLIRGIEIHRSDEKHSLTIQSDGQRYDIR